MRIVGGTWRGRPIQAPEGRDTRPTLDRVRESLASVVMARVSDLEQASVLDAFAGSGAMGLEMLSRGARRATFFDNDAKAIACLRRNLTSLKVPPALARSIHGDVMQSAQRGALPGAPFDIVILDPPYATPVEQMVELLGAIARRGGLAQGCMVIYERNARGAQLQMEGLALVKTYTYGKTKVDLLQWGADDGAPSGDGDEGEEE